MTKPSFETEKHKRWLLYSHFVSLWLQSPSCIPLRHATHFPPLILSTPFILFFYACVFPCIHIFHCIYTYYNEECSRSEGLNQLIPMIKKDNESKGTLISSLIMWLLFLSFSNRNFSFPQFSAAFETQFSLLNTLPNESCSIYHNFHFFVILLVFFFLWKGF